MIISASELAGRLGEPGLVLIDVRLAEDFACGHLPGALNQCVYEVAFLPALKSRGIAPGTTICVYGAAEDSFESRMAAGKLERAGYTHVLEFRGGWEAWLRERRPTDQPRAETPVSSRIKDGVHALDLDESKAVWIGRNLLNKHWGHVAIASGEVEIKNGIPLRGEATLDMRRITCSDLAGNELHDVLIHHLESDDFFDTERFPEARFTFDRVERCADKPGCRNLGLLGNLTLRGVTRPLSIDAVAGVTGEGRAALQSTFAINRTEWGVLYGSGSFFRKLAGHLVNDEIELQLRIVTA